MLFPYILRVLKKEKNLKLVEFDITKMKAVILEATNPEGGKNCKLNETLFFKVYRVLLNTKKKPPKIPRIKTCFLRPFQIAQWVEKGFDEDI